MKQTQSKFVLKLRRIKDGKRHPNYAVTHNGEEVTQLRFLSHGYGGWLPTPEGHGFSMPEDSLWSWRLQVWRLRREARHARSHVTQHVAPPVQLKTPLNLNSPSPVIPA
jgi:hypothetical protein